MFDRLLEYAVDRAMNHDDFGGFLILADWCEENGLVGEAANCRYVGEKKRKPLVNPSEYDPTPVFWSCPKLFRGNDALLTDPDDLPEVLFQKVKAVGGYHWWKGFPRGEFKQAYEALVRAV